MSHFRILSHRWNSHRWLLRQAALRTKGCVGLLFSGSPPLLFSSLTLCSLIQRCLTTFISTPAAAKPSPFRSSNVFLRADRLVQSGCECITCRFLYVYILIIPKRHRNFKGFTFGVVFGSYKAWEKDIGSSCIPIIPCTQLSWLSMSLLEASFFTVDEAAVAHQWHINVIKSQ